MKKGNSKTLSGSYQRHICLWCYLEWHALQQKMQKYSSYKWQELWCLCTMCKIYKTRIIPLQKNWKPDNIYVIHQRPKYVHDLAWYYTHNALNKSTTILELTSWYKNLALYDGHLRTASNNELLIFSINSLVFSPMTI